MAEGARGSNDDGRKRRPRTPQEKFPKGYFDCVSAIDFVQLGIYSIPQIYRLAESLSKSVPGLQFISWSVVCVVLKTLEVPMCETAGFPFRPGHQPEDWAGGSRPSFKATRFHKCH